MTALLKVDNLVKHFPVSGGLLSREREKVHAVNGVSFELAAGDTFAIVGSSGSGKTTLLGLCAGLDRATAGSVWEIGRAHV